MKVAVARSTKVLREELDQLAQFLDSAEGPEQVGFGTWKHRMYAVIEEVCGASSSTAIKFSGIRWDPLGARLAPSRASWAKRQAGEVIDILRWELDQRAIDAAPFGEATIDPPLWQHVRTVFEAQEWDKVALSSAVFIEDRLREWAHAQAARGSVDVFKTALASDHFRLGSTQGEEDGWRQLGTGFALALRNPSGHRIDARVDPRRYALGVLGVASLLLTEIKGRYGDPPKLPGPDSRRRATRP